MNKHMLFGGLGVGCAVMLGIGMSLAHTGGVFPTDEPDWLEIGQQNTVVVPRGPSIVQTPNVAVEAAVEASLQAPSSLIAPADDDAVELVTAPASSPSLAPVTSLAPQVRPVLALTPAPQPAPQIAAPAPVVAAPTPPVIQERAKAALPSDFANDSVAYERSLLAPPAAPLAQTDPIDNVWLLGVYR